MTQTSIPCVRGNVSVVNFRLCVGNNRKGSPPDLPNAAGRCGSGSISADIHGCHDKNLQETQEVVPVSANHLIINKKQCHTFFCRLLTCVTINF